MDVNPETSKNSLHHTVYKEKEFYFCSPFCKAAFVEEPENFIVKWSKNYKKKFKP